MWKSLLLLVAALAVTTCATSPPDPDDKAATARWLVHRADYTFIATVSSVPQRAVFGNVQSMADGTLAPDNSTGVPYFYVSPLDTSMIDVAQDPRVSITITEQVSTITQYYRYTLPNPMLTPIILLHRRPEPHLNAAEHQ